MKKHQNNSHGASALQITILIGLMAVSALLFASSFMAAPATLNSVPGQTQHPGFYPPLPVSASAAQPGFYPPLPVSASAAQPGFYPPLPVSAPGQQGGFFPPLPPQGTGITVSLPVDTMDVSVPISTVIIEAVVTTNIDSSLNYVGFQGDFTFDSTVVTFANPPAQKAGLSGGNLNVSGNNLP